jgi:hypothetical protein
MPSLIEILKQLHSISIGLVVVGFFITTGVIILLRDWRICILAMLGQYLLMGVMLSRLVRPEIALVKVIVGAFICPILYLSARQVLWGREDRRQRAMMLSPEARSKYLTRQALAGGNAFRLFSALLMVLTAIALSQRFPLEGVPEDITLASYWLILAGILILSLTDEPFKAGMGLLTIIIAFELIYTHLERSLILVALWAAVNLLIALAIGYLTIVQGIAPEEDL